MFDEAEGAAEQADRYFEREDVLGELEEFSARALEAPEHPDPRNSLLADNWFAYVFYTAKQHRAARPHLQRIGRAMDRGVWLIRAPGWELMKARVRAGLFPI